MWRHNELNQGIHSIIDDDQHLLIIHAIEPGERAGEKGYRHLIPVSFHYENEWGEMNDTVPFERLLLMALHGKERISQITPENKLPRGEYNWASFRVLSHVRWREYVLGLQEYTSKESHVLKQIF